MLHTGPHSGRLTCVRGQRVHEDPTGTALMQPLQDLARPIDAPVIYKREIKRRMGVKKGDKHRA